MKKTNVIVFVVGCLLAASAGAAPSAKPCPAGALGGAPNFPEPHHQTNDGLNAFPEKVHSYGQHLSGAAEDVLPGIQWMYDSKTAQHYNHPPSPKATACQQNPKYYIIPHGIVPNDYGLHLYPGLLAATPDPTPGTCMAKAQQNLVPGKLITEDEVIAALDQEWEDGEAMGNRDWSGAGICVYSDLSDPDGDGILNVRAGGAWLAKYGQRMFVTAEGFSVHDEVCEATRTNTGNLMHKFLTQGGSQEAGWQLSYSPESKVYYTKDPRPYTGFERVDSIRRVVHGGEVMGVIVLGNDGLQSRVCYFPKTGRR